MKRFIRQFIVLNAILFSGFLCYGNEMTHYLGIGIRLPSFLSAKTKVSNTDFSISAITFGGDVSYLGVFDNGLSIEGNLGVFTGPSKFKVDDETSDTELSFGFNWRLGLGYGFVRTEKIYFGLLGFIGCEQYILANDYNVRDVKNRLSVKSDRFIMGIDPVIHYSVSDNVTLFANCGIGASFGKLNVESKTNGMTSTSDFSVSPIIYPTIGIAYKTK